MPSTVEAPRLIIVAGRMTPPNKPKNRRFRHVLKPLSPGASFGVIK
jgi:hypothetical protein